MNVKPPPRPPLRPPPRPVITNHDNGYFLSRLTVIFKEDVEYYRRVCRLFRQAEDAKDTEEKNELREQGRSLIYGYQTKPRPISPPTDFIPI